MKTLLIDSGGDGLPVEVVEIVRAGSTEVQETTRTDDAARRDADRVVVWERGALTVEDRRLRWPDDRDELRLLFQSAG